MKLLYAFPEPLPLPRARGGQVVQTVRALAGEGIDVTLAYTPAGSDPFAALGLERPANVALKPVSRNLPAPLSRWHSNRLFVRRLAQLIEVERPDVVFVRHIKLAAALRDAFADLPIVYEAHEVFADTAEPGRRTRVSAVERRAVEGASALVANSAATAARLRECYAVSKPIAVVSNGVERPETMPQKDWSQSAQRVVYAGSLFEWKGVGDLIAAAALLPGCTITIAGGEPEEIESLGRHISTGGAQVVLVGRLPAARVRALLESSCIAVLPNRAGADSSFTSPIKLFEYMAAGCAVVASNLPAVREILGESDAVWFKPGDPTSLAGALRGLIAGPGLVRELGMRLYAQSANLTWSRRGKRLASVVREMLDARLP